ncbi:MAG: 5'-nucleotidase C-terminal domain-containing protein [Pseudomonadota bacterium]|nr:5'-nucleotidase C-terminal domain-containing protein [Pseudomonadota bacterium]
MKVWRLTALAAMVAGLAACGGEDGKDGAQGPAGPQGLQGLPGQQAPSNEDNSMSLSILHMNDHHSHIAADDFGFDVSELGLEATVEVIEEAEEEGGEDTVRMVPLSEVDVTYGGFPMMVSLFNSLQMQSDNVLKLHSGDAITGTLYYSLFKGRADADMMNQICFDAFALGNHEFDDGDTGLANFLDSLNSSACVTPTLAANVNPAENSAIAEGYIEPYTIVEREGQKIGIIGIDIAGKTKNSSSPDDGTTFSDETTTAQQYIDELTGMGVNKIILMTHYQYANDLELAAALNGVDVIVGGDSHTLLGDETFVELGFNTQGEYPTVVTDAGGKTVCVVQAWEYAHLMGKLDVDFDADGNVTACAGQPYMPISTTYEYEYNDAETRTLTGADVTRVTTALTKEDEIVAIRPDATTQAILDVYNEDVEVLKQTVIGTNAENLCLERIPGQGRSTICDVSATYENGSDISNVVAKAFLMVTPTADIAIQNGGGVRVDLAAGDVTIADAFTLLPFSNTLVILDMTGQQIIDVLEDALANFLDNGGSSGSYPYASGLRYDIDASQTKGSRVSNVEINAQVSGSWSAIDVAATYRVVTNDFIASGQDGYTTFSVPFDAGNYEDTYTEYAQGFIDYVEALTEDGQQVQKLPIEEYSTQLFIDADGCNHSTDAGCD